MTDLLEGWVNSLELSEDVSNLDDVSALRLCRPPPSPAHPPAVAAVPPRPPPVRPSNRRMPRESHRPPRSPAPRHDGQDMRNGFLLGELLFRHNQLHTFGKFLRTNNSDAKINNWCLIEPALRAMNIKFDAQMANSIMQGKPGAASTVLYKVVDGQAAALPRPRLWCRPQSQPLPTPEP